MIRLPLPFNWIPRLLPLTALLSMRFPAPVLKIPAPVIEMAVLLTQRLAVTRLSSAKAMPPNVLPAAVQPLTRQRLPVAMPPTLPAAAQSFTTHPSPTEMPNSVLLLARQEITTLYLPAKIPCCEF